MNYEITCSDVRNYDNLLKTASPNSFPSFMETGVLVKYEVIQYQTEILDKSKENANQGLVQS